MNASAAPLPTRSTRWLPLLAGVLLLAIFAVTWALRSLSLEPGERLALALLPVALWGAAIFVLVAGVRRLDELQRRIQLEALAIAYPAAMMLGMVVEYLQKAGFLGGWTVGDVWPAMALLYAPAWLYARSRY